MKQMHLKNQKGFTLIELIVVIVILGILAAAAVPMYRTFKQDAAYSSAQGLLGAMRGATQINFAKNLISAGTLTPITTAQTLLDAIDTEGYGSLVPSGTTVTLTIDNFQYQYDISPVESTTNAAKIVFTDIN